MNTINMADFAKYRQVFERSGTSLFIRTYMDSALVDETEVQHASLHNTSSAFIQNIAEEILTVLALKVGSLPATQLGTQTAVKYAMNPGQVIAALTDTTGWTIGQTGVGGTVTPSTLSNGTPGLQLSIPAGAGTVTITNTAALAVTYAPDTVLGIWLEVADPGRVPGISVLLSNDAAFTNYRTVSVGGSGGAVHRDSLYFIPFRCDSGVATGSPTANGAYTYIRIRVNNPYKNQGGSVKIAGLGYAPAGRPKVAFTFDDGYAEQYTTGFRILSKYGIVGTIAVTSSFIGGAGRLTLQMLQAMDKAGWAMVGHGVQHYGFNGSTASGNFGPTTLCLSQAPASAGALTLNGTLGNTAFDQPRHVVAWGGDQGVKLTIVGKAADGVTNQTEDLYLQANAHTPSTKVFTGPVTLAVDQASAAFTVGTSLSKDEMTYQITGSQGFLVSNGMTRGAYDWVYPSGEFNTTSTQILIDLGFKRARLVNGQWSNPAAGDFRGLTMGGYGGTISSGGSAAFLAQIDTAIDTGRNCLPYLHNMSPTTQDSGTALFADVQLVIDGLAQRARDGKCDLVTQVDLPVAY